MTRIVSQSHDIHTEPQIDDDTTLLRDMHARHRYSKSQDMVIHDTWTTGITWISALQTYGYSSMFH